MNPTAFNAFAHDYDTEFTHTRLGQLLRPRVWHVLAQQFTAGQHVLELACGTGEDAVWLARRGITVTATDGSPEMLATTAAKVQQAGVDDHVQTIQLSLQEVGDGCSLNTQHDGIFSNFGGLNTIDEWRPLAENLAQLVRPGGKVVLVVMGPVCPWEVGWHLLHGEWGTAVRRFRDQAIATIGNHTIPIWYPSARRLRHDFAPWFRHISTQSLGLWLPPSYLGHLVERRPRLFAWLNRFETKTAHFTGGWGDHYILLLERQPGL